MMCDFDIQDLDINAWNTGLVNRQCDDQTSDHKAANSILYPLWSIGCNHSEFSHSVVTMTEYHVSQSST